MLLLGSEMVEDLRRGPQASVVDWGGSEVRGLKREFVEDVAEGRVRESFFMLRERCLLGGGKMKESVSEVVEERVEEEAGLSESMACSARAAEGVSMRRGAGGHRLRGGSEAGTADCGRGVAVSMF